MSSHKQNKTDWVICDQCAHSVPRYALTKHQSKCQDVNGYIGDGEDEHGSIRDGVLQAFVRIEPLGEGKSSRYPEHKRDFILINPTTLKRCCFCIAGSVVVKYKGRETYCVVWPSSSVPMDVVYLHNSKLISAGASGKLVTVQKNISIPIIADRLTLTRLPDSEQQDSPPGLHEKILQSLDGSLVHCGDIVDVDLLGKNYTYTVKQITGACGVQTEPDCGERKHSEQLELTFSEMHIVNGLPKKDVSNLFSERTSQNPGFVYSLNFLETKIDILLEEKPLESEIISPKFASLSSLGGMNQTINELRELVELPILQPELFSQCNLTPPTGVLLYGEPGTGKSSLMQAIAEEVGVNFVAIQAAELLSKFYGEAEQRLRGFFTSAIRDAPSLVLIDDLATVCPSVRTESGSEARLASTLVSLLDELTLRAPTQPLKPVILLATTNRPDSIDPTLRRPGRLDNEIELSVPNQTQRLDILCKLISGRKHSLIDGEITDLSERTHGYVGADLAAVCKEASSAALKRILPAARRNVDDASHVSTLAEEYLVCVTDFQTALTRVRPSAMRSILIDVPHVAWTDIGGQERVKQRLREAIEWPLRQPQAFQRLGIGAPRGLLMYGPPGCSKTMMAKALATESGLNFISIKGPELFSKFLGESEAAVREVFRKARSAAPSIVFFDEIDALAVQRSGSAGGGAAGDRVLAQILTEMDGVESLDGVIVVAATNRPDVIDPALLRPGRIDRLIYVPLPDAQARAEIFRIQFISTPVHEDVSTDELVELSSGYSGAEICSCVREAAMTALREDMSALMVTRKHFVSVFGAIRPATTAESVQFYDEFAQKTCLL